MQGTRDRNKAPLKKSCQLCYRLRVIYVTNLMRRTNLGLKKSRKREKNKKKAVYQIVKNEGMHHETREQMKIGDILMITEHKKYTWAGDVLNFKLE